MERYGFLGRCHKHARATTDDAEYVWFENIQALQTTQEFDNYAINEAAYWNTFVFNGISWRNYWSSRILLHDLLYPWSLILERNYPLQVLRDRVAPRKWIMAACPE